MPRIAIFGTGRIGRIIFSGIDALHSTENICTKNNVNFLDSINIDKINKPDYKSLVNAYKKVQRKYNPEKDIFINK